MLTAVEVQKMLGKRVRQFRACYKDASMDAEPLEFVLSESGRLDFTSKTRTFRASVSDYPVEVCLMDAIKRLTFGALARPAAFECTIDPDRTPPVDCRDKSGT